LAIFNCIGSIGTVLVGIGLALALQGFLQLFECGEFPLVVYVFFLQVEYGLLCRVGIDDDGELNFFV
jgi:hypothetical protein